MQELDPHVLASALAEKIDRDLGVQLDGLVREATTPQEMIGLVFRAHRTATETLLTQLITLLPEEDRECVVKLFKLRPR